MEEEEELTVEKGPRKVVMEDLTVVVLSSALFWTARWTFQILVGDPRSSRKQYYWMHRAIVAGGLLYLALLRQ